MLIFYLVITTLFLYQPVFANTISNITFNQDLPANANIIFVGTTSDFKITLTEAMINSALSNPDSTTVLFGDNSTNSDNIPVCIANNNLENGVQLKITQTSPAHSSTGQLVMEASNANPTTNTKAIIPIVLEWIPNGQATSDDFSDTNANTVIGDSDHTLTGAIQFTNGEGIVHLDHFDTLSTGDNTYDASDTAKQGCEATPAYLKIFVKNSDLSDAYAGSYNITLSFESIACSDITDDTNQLECTG